LGLVAIWVVPVFVRDAAYSAFARNRGKIWIGVKRVTGMGDTRMEPYRGSIMGLEGFVDPGWGFDKERTG